MEMNKYETLSQVRSANKAAGQHWFDPDTMRFFKSRIYGVMGTNSLACNRYFISSEANPEGVRRFTVRMVNIFDGIETVGEFHSHRTQSQALRALWEHANKSCDCGHLPTPTDGPGTGYARLSGTDDRTICYECADSMTLRDIADAKPGDRMTFYISSDGDSVTTWTGGKLMRVLKWGARHPWSNNNYDGPRHYVRAIDANGYRWYGTGANGMYATLRKSKA